VCGHCQPRGRCRSRLDWQLPTWRRRAPFDPLYQVVTTQPIDQTHGHRQSTPAPHSAPRHRQAIPQWCLSHRMRHAQAPAAQYRRGHHSGLYGAGAGMCAGIASHAGGVEVVLIGGGPHGGGALHPIRTIKLRVRNPLANQPRTAPQRGFTARHPRDASRRPQRPVRGRGRAMVALFQVGRGPGAIPISRLFPVYKRAGDPCRKLAALLSPGAVRLQTNRGTVQFRHVGGGWMGLFATMRRRAPSNPLCQLGTRRLLNPCPTQRHNVAGIASHAGGVEVVTVGGDLVIGCNRNLRKHMVGVGGFPICRLFFPTGKS